MSNTLAVLIVQMQSIDEAGANLNQLLALLSAQDCHNKVIFLPENALYMRMLEGERIPGLGAADSLWGTLQSFVNAHECAIHVGSVPWAEGPKLTNASIWLTPHKPLQVSYRKMHLFDIHLENDRPIRESDVFSHGARPQILTWQGWSMGQSICYDLRFAELYSHYAKHGVEVVLVPSAFLPKTGAAHWHALLRARAIESQCYVIAAAQAGQHQGLRGTRKTFGHSLVVDPWGEIQAEGDGVGPVVLQFELQKEKIQTVRSQIPMHMHRRNGL